MAFVVVKVGIEPTDSFSSIAPDLTMIARLLYVCFLHSARTGGHPYLPAYEAQRKLEAHEARLIALRKEASREKDAGGKGWNRTNARAITQSADESNITVMAKGHTLFHLSYFPIIGDVIHPAADGMPNLCIYAVSPYRVLNRCLFTVRTMIASSTAYRYLLGGYQPV